MAMARFLGALVLCLAVAVFTVQNDQAIHLAYLGMTAPAVHLAFLILAALILGAAVTVLLGGLQVLRLRRRIAGLERDLETVRADLTSAVVARDTLPTGPAATPAATTREGGAGADTDADGAAGAPAASSASPSPPTPAGGSR